MIDKLLIPVTLFTAISSGLIGGIFFAFSNFVMKALAKLPASSGIAAMQTINVTVINPLFMILFVGTAVGSLCLVTFSLLRWHHPASVWLLVGGLLYFLGTFVVTAACNVPRNDALAPLDPANADAASVWLRYATEWTKWNHVRTLAAIAAAVALTVALMQSKAVVP